MNTLLVKRTVLVGIAAFAIVAAGLGVVDVQQMSAATPTTNDGPRDRAAMHDKMQAEVAKNLGISVEKLQKATDDARNTLGLPDHKAGDGHRGKGGRPGGPGGPGGFLKPAADVLGLSVEDLWLKLQDRSLADVAGDKKDEVATALKKAFNDRIDDRIDEMMKHVMKPHQKTGGEVQPRGFGQQADGFQFQQRGPRF